MKMWKTSLAFAQAGTSTTGGSTDAGMGPNASASGGADAGMSGTSKKSKKKAKKKKSSTSTTDAGSMPK